MPDLAPAIAALAAPLPPGIGEVVVVFRTDKIGDLLVTTPLLRAIKASRPDAYVVLICSPYNCVVAANMPEVDRIVAYDNRADRRDKWRFAMALRGLRPAAVLVMSPSSDSYWFALLSGAKQRAGIVMSYRRMQRLTAPLLLTAFEVIDRKKLDRKPDQGFHIAEIALRMGERCGFARPGDVSLSAPTAAVERQWAASVAPAGPRIVLHLGETWRECNMDEAAIAALSVRIEETFPDATLLMTVGPAEQAYLKAMRATFSQIISTSPLVLASAQHPRALLLAGLSFGAWNALIESADLVVTPDTSAVHVAAAHHRPVVAVYVAHRFNAMTSLYGPWQTPCRPLRAGAESGTLQVEIIAAMRELLAPQHADAA